jgi:hypothetical protein
VAAAAAACDERWRVDGESHILLNADADLCHTGIRRPAAAAAGGGGRTLRTDRSSRSEQSAERPFAPTYTRTAANVVGYRRTSDGAYLPESNVQPKANNFPLRTELEKSHLAPP